MLLCSSILVGSDELEVTALRAGSGVSWVMDSRTPEHDQMLCEITKKTPNRLQENSIEIIHRIVDGEFKPELRLAIFLDEYLYDKVFRLIFEMALEAELLFEFEGDRTRGNGTGVIKTIDLKPEEIHKSKHKYLTELDIRVFMEQV